MQHVPISPVSVDQIGSTVSAESLSALKDIGSSARKQLGKRRVWNLNSTAQGGGVAEMLQPILAYVRGFGIDVRWSVISGHAEFFVITKRIHNHIHGHPGDGGPLGPAERRAYEAVAAKNAADLADEVRPGDIFICHDPQTAGLIPCLRHHGCWVIWRCHIGHDRPNQLTTQAWAFLMPYLQEAHRYIFTRRSYAPPGLDPARVEVIPPSIDPLSVKNQPMANRVARAILRATGILAGTSGSSQPRFVRQDGLIGIVRRKTEITRVGPALPPRQRLIVQVSRWDHLKDPIGVMNGFARHLKDQTAALLLAGPSVASIADDPEGAKVLDAVIAAWHDFPETIRQRILIACLPMDDREENAAIVNALQRHATIIVQKSLHEGFGLTVTEAMWKGRPVVASAVGGIQDQIKDDVHGLLIRDPTDLPAFAAACDRILADPQRARRLRHNARQRVKQHFLLVRHLNQYQSLLGKLLASEQEPHIARHVG